MPPKKQDKVLVACPRCGHRQPEPRTAFSSACKKCGEHLRVQEILRPPPKPAERAPDQKRITCFECGAELDVALSAESTMCKRCGRYVDLHDYRITTALAKNFKTKGTFIVEPKGYVFNTEALVGDAVIKGRFLGKLDARHSLTIYSSAQIKGSLTTARLIIPANNHFRWPDRLDVGAAEIAGELAASLHANGTVTLKTTARLFGDIEAGNLVVEEGAVLVGQARIGMRPPS
jgi:cytoskeletal protein CcmA (bactofilin family)/DNA-directed RNA polymerase subunit RPC12/RpoP